MRRERKRWGGRAEGKGWGKHAWGRKRGEKKGRYVWEGAKGKGEVRLPPPSFFHFSRVKHEIVYRRFDLPRQ